MNHCEREGDYSAFFHFEKADETKADKDTQCNYRLRYAKFGYVAFKIRCSGRGGDHRGSHCVQQGSSCADEPQSLTGELEEVGIVGPV